MKIGKQKSSESNKTMVQAFEYYSPVDHNHWNTVKAQAEEFRKLHITSAWLPPAYKSWQDSDLAGYAVYDKYDLGDCNQQGGVPTKYGTKQQLLECIAELHHQKIAVIMDIVMNHMIGGDGNDSYTSTVRECNTDDRKNDNLRTTHKDFVSYPNFHLNCHDDPALNEDWDASYFTGFEMNDKIYLYEGKEWDPDVDWEHGNYDALMGMNLDLRNPKTKERLIKWGKWFLKETKADGVRLDAIKHMNAAFIREWVNEMTLFVAQDRGIAAAKNFYVVGEYWSTYQDRIEHYLSGVNQTVPTDDEANPQSEEVEDSAEPMIEEVPINVFDVGLHATFIKNHYFQTDLSQILHDSLLRGGYKDNAVTFVDNHDTQCERSLKPEVDRSFKLQAYAMIMFQEHGLPCVFYGDLYGYEYYKGSTHIYSGPRLKGLRRMCLARYTCAHGAQVDYIGRMNYIADGGTRVEFEKNVVQWDHCVAYTRSGGGYTYGGMVVMLSNADPAAYPYPNIGRVLHLSKRKPEIHANEEFIDILHPDRMLKLDEHGYGDFYVPANGAAVWIRKTAYDYLMKNPLFRDDI